jgi:hypothetical protein
LDPTYKNILRNLYLHIWLVANTWLNFFMDDLEENYKFENIKILKNIDVIIIIIIYNSFVYVLNEFLKFIFKYLNINLKQKQVNFFKNHVYNS